MARSKRRLAPGMKKVNNPAYVTCTQHGKKGYFTKQEACRAVRMYHPAEHMSVYPCATNESLWHIGHLPPSIIKRGVPRQVVFRS